MIDPLPFKPKFSIRRVDGLKESQLLKDLQKTILPYDREETTNTGWWWIARTADGFPAAFCGMKRSSKWSDTVYLCRAGVLRDFRGHGLQARLIRVRALKAKELGMNWLVSDTYDNPASSNSLINCGFKLYDPSSPWGAKGTLYWRKRLHQPTKCEDTE